MHKDKIITISAMLIKDNTLNEKYLKELSSLLDKNYQNYEILFINNSLPYQTSSDFLEIQKSYKKVRLINLSKIYDDEYAKLAILDNSIGDYTIIMNIVEDPIYLIIEMINKSLDGNDLVIGEVKSRDNSSFKNKIYDGGFAKLSKTLTGYTINPNYSDYICISRRMVNSLIHIRDRRRYLKYLFLEVGFKHTSIKFEKNHKINKINFTNIVNQIGILFDVSISNSSSLFKLTSFLGLTLSFINLIYIVYIFFIIFLKNDIAEGWISSNLVSSTMFFFIFLILTIIGLNISSILKETKKGRLYYVSEEISIQGNINEENKSNVV